MSFDEIFDLTAGVYFSFFYNIYRLDYRLVYILQKMSARTHGSKLIRCHSNVGKNTKNQDASGVSSTNFGSVLNFFQAVCWYLHYTMWVFFSLEGSCSILY